MKSKILLLLFLAVFVSLTLVSAIANVELKTLDVPAATHGQDVTVRFNISNKDVAVDYTQLIWTDTTLSAGTIKQLPTLASLLHGESKEVALVANIPQYAQGSVSLQLKVKNGAADSAPAILPVTLTISATPALAITQVKPLTVVQNGTVTLTNTGNVLLNNVDLSVPLELVGKVTFSADNFVLVPGASKTLDVAGVNVLSGVKFGTSTVTVTAKDTTQTAATATTSFTLAKAFCVSGPQSDNLTIDRVNIESTGKKTKWMPLDEITVTVKVRNRGTESLSDVIAEIGIFDSSGDDVTSDFDFTSTDAERVDLGRISKNADETATFEFQVPGDMTDGDYRLAVKAYSDDFGESKICVDTSSDLSNSFYETITIDRESEAGKFIAFNKMSFSPNQAVCGESVALNTKVYNVGDEDQDRIKVRLVNTELKIDASQELRNGLDQGDSATATLTFAIPRTAVDKTYDLQLTASYDYRNSEYRENLDEAIVLPFKVFGCANVANVSNDILSIVSTPTSEAKAGQVFTVKSLVKNIGTQSITAIMNVKGHESWAKLDKISDRLVQLAPGETKEITLTFTINPTASGSQAFTLEVNTGDRIEAEETTVQLPVAQSNLFGTLANNKIVWILGIVNILLIIIVIVVAVKIAQR